MLTSIGELPEILATEAAGTVLMLQPVVLTEFQLSQTLVPAVTERLPLLPFKEKSLMVGAPVLVLLLVPATQVKDVLGAVAAMLATVPPYTDAASLCPGVTGTVIEVATVPYW